MKLAELAAAAGIDLAPRASEVEIIDLAFDSRRVSPGSLYFCVRGERHDGHDFAGAAVENGAGALVVERPLGLAAAELVVEDSRAAMAPVADRFFGSPSEAMIVAGVTGTNGKTTTAWLLHAILRLALGPCGLMGTVKRIVGGVDEPVAHTTAEAIDIQADLDRMRRVGDVACVMEVSSHALELHRCDAIEFDVSIFTNLTQDHLDFHGDMESYFAAKRRLFEMTPGAGVINIDDPHGRLLWRELGGTSCSAAGATEADFRAESVQFDASGSRFELVAPAAIQADAGRRHSVQIGLPGLFNVANALAAIAAAWRVGVPISEAVAALAEVDRVPGRLDPVEEGQDFAVLVDYAHTPDSLDNVLRAARRITSGRLISVFGAGGDRDRDKRPKMGRVGAELSDLAVITSDNPRSEQPEAILAEVARGAEGARSEIELVVDRREAIRLALGRASTGDTVVIAGKGHESGQEFEGGRKIPFDDREVARDALREQASDGRDSSQARARR